MALSVRRLLQGFNALLILAASLSAPAAVSAQMPGRWVEAYRLPLWRMSAMVFGDTQHGVLLLDSSWNWNASLTTSDGGATWNLHARNASTTGEEIDPISSETVQMPNASDVYVLNGTATYLSGDEGDSWQQYKLAMLPASFPAIWQIFDHGISRAITWTLSYGVSVWTSSDSGKYFYPFVGSPDAPGLARDSFRDAIFLDTLEFWASNTGGRMAHTTDDGYTWNSIPVMPSLDSLHSFSGIRASQNPNRFYVLLGRNKVPLDHRGMQDTFVSIPPIAADFAETTDDGQTWRIDSSLGDSRIYRMVSPARNKLWAFVGRVPPFYSPVGMLIYTGAGHAYPRQFADSLFYSPDDGRTWFKDPTTFAGDTLLEMCWPDSTHGYIAAWRDSTLLVYRFVPNPADVAPTRMGLQTLSITPNPACATVTIISSAKGRVHLLNLLGSDVLDATIHPNGTLTLDVSHLPRGVYMVMLEKNDKMVSAGHVVLTGE